MNTLTIETFQVFQDSLKTEATTAQESSAHRVCRGGGWQDDAGDCRSACRSYWNDPAYRHYDLGFRLARRV